MIYNWKGKKVKLCCVVNLKLKVQGLLKWTKPKHFHSFFWSFLFDPSYNHLLFKSLFPTELETSLLTPFLSFHRFPSTPCQMFYQSLKSYSNQLRKKLKLKQIKRSINLSSVTPLRPNCRKEVKINCFKF